MKQSSRVELPSVTVLSLKGHKWTSQIKRMVVTGTLKQYFVTGYDRAENGTGFISAVMDKQR